MYKIHIYSMATTKETTLHTPANKAVQIPGNILSIPRNIKIYLNPETNPNHVGVWADFTAPLCNLWPNRFSGTGFGVSTSPFTPPVARVFSP